MHILKRDLDLEQLYNVLEFECTPITMSTETSKGTYTSLDRYNIIVENMFRIYVINVQV